MECFGQKLIFKLLANILKNEKLIKKKKKKCKKYSLDTCF